MREVFSRLLYPLVVVVVVGTTWCMAWARSVTDQARDGYWPAHDPAFMRRAGLAYDAGTTDAAVTHLVDDEGAIDAQ